jgi:hypothetical protein
VFRNAERRKQVWLSDSPWDGSAGQEKEMTGFKFPQAFAMLSILIATETEANGIGGRDVAVPPSSVACMTDQGPSVCGEPMWVHGTIGNHSGKKTALSPELNSPPGNREDQPRLEWPANMILG